MPSYRYLIWRKILNVGQNVLIKYKATYEKSMYEHMHDIFIENRNRYSIVMSNDRYF